MRDVHTREGDARAEGGCNGCTDMIDAETGRISGRVTCISLRGLSVRLCDKCKAILIARLTGLEALEREADERHDIAQVELDPDRYNEEP